MVDAAADARDTQDMAVEAVLEEIGAANVPRIRVLNKIDACGLDPGVERDAYGTISSVRVSALTGAGCGDLRAALAERFPLAQPRAGTDGSDAEPADSGAHC